MGLFRFKAVKYLRNYGEIVIILLDMGYSYFMDSDPNL